MNGLRILALCGTTTLLLGGCAANEVMIKRQTEADAKIEHLYQVSGGIEARLNEYNSRLAMTDDRAADLGKQLIEIKETLKELRESNQALMAKFQKMSVPTTPKIEVVNPEPVVKGKETGPPAAYVKAFGLYSANNFDAAVQAFESFLKEQPASEYAPNATYWVGECYYSRSDLKKAMDAFQKVVDVWPAHPKAPDALLKLGYSHTALKQPDKAKAVFEKIVRSYPGSPAAVKAREKLSIQ